MDVCAQICAHYLTHDDIDDVSFIDGQPVFPTTAASPKGQVRRTRRIIIYSEFASMAPLFQNVCISLSAGLMSGKHSRY